MKVLITGGSGFLGSHLADRLLAADNEVLSFDNYETGRRENLSERDGLTLVEGTIAERDQVDAAFKDFKPEAVLKINTLSFGLIHPLASRRRSAATHAAPSGQKKSPSAFPMRGISESISSSLTLIAVPRLSRIACSIKKSPTA